MVEGSNVGSYGFGQPTAPTAGLYIELLLLMILIMELLQRGSFFADATYFEMDPANPAVMYEKSSMEFDFSLSDGWIYLSEDARAPISTDCSGE